MRGRVASPFPRQLYPPCVALEYLFTAGWTGSEHSIKALAWLQSSTSCAVITCSNHYATPSMHGNWRDQNSNIFYNVLFQ